MADKMIPVRVECYAGYRSEETPTCFYINDRRVSVATVVDRWLAPEHRYFKVCDSEGDLYILRHDVAEDGWELTMFESGGCGKWFSQGGRT